MFYNKIEPVNSLNKQYYYCSITTSLRVVQTGVTSEADTTGTTVSSTYRKKISTMSKYIQVLLTSNSKCMLSVIFQHLATCSLGADCAYNIQ